MADIKSYQPSLITIYGSRQSPRLSVLAVKHSTASPPHIRILNYSGILRILDTQKKPENHVMKSSIETVDAYLEQQPEKVRAVLQKLRQTVKQLVPQAEEVISYQIPAFKYHGMLLYYAGFKDHCSLFPGDKSLLIKFKEELKDFDIAKGTIRFTVDKPLPAALVKKIVKERVTKNLIKSKK